jgi:hypothetical protein
MASMKLLQTLGAFAVIAGYFLPWSSLNFGASLNKAAAVVERVVPGGVGGLTKLDQPGAAAATAAGVAAQGGVLKDAKAALQIPTGEFSGLNLTTSGKLLYLLAAVPAFALIVLILSWFTPRGTGQIGLLLSLGALGLLVGVLIASFAGGVVKDASATAAGAASAITPPQGVTDSLKLLVRQLLYGFWVTAGGAILMLASSPFAKKPLKG